MKIEITATPKTIEVTNMILAMAISELKEKPHLRAEFGITEKQLEGVINFRQSMLKSFTGR